MTIPILPVAQVRAAEVEANANGVPYAEMMQRAGRAIAARIAALLGATGKAAADWRVVFLIGPGNNGGDGLVAGRVLAAEFGAQVHFYLLAPRAPNDALMQAVRDAGLTISMAADDSGFGVLTQAVCGALIVVDALFGIGARLPLSEGAILLLSATSQALSRPHSAVQPFQSAEQPTAHPARPAMLAVDCPSGLDCDSGALEPAALSANETITMIAVKPGLLTFPGAEAVGRLTIAGLELPADLSPLKSATSHLFTADDASALLPPRSLNSHKGTFGHVLVAGGSANYSGAPALSARAAYRMGAGLVTVATPAPVAGWLAGALQECTWLPLPHSQGALTADAAPLMREQWAAASALVIGMGLGRNPATADFLTELLIARHQPPLVLDADGLSLLSTLPGWPEMLPPGTIITPHPGEMGRLCGMSAQEVVAQRWTVALEKAAEWNVVVLLKGAHTLIAAPDGQLRVLPFKTSALATAGTGDVLAGTIGTLRAQGLSPFDAASLGGFMHGTAGELAAQKLGSERAVCAGDVVEALPAAIAALGG
ncbi:MAG: NAD(P)H-hydrate dehydratase [Anaerolineae bacterium]|nr:NAD(P)H-hydrate dehydratase [Anaerolineae bacterium]